MESCKLYDCMAVIIRYLLNENFEADMAYAVPSNYEENMLEEAEELLEEGFSFTDFSILSGTYKSNLVMLPFLLQKLDEKAAKLLEEELWIERLDFESVRCMDSLNSEDNVKATSIIILPRYTCIWEGKSRDGHMQAKLTEYIEKVVRRADENGNKILVFPEMLGTVGMKNSLIESIRNVSLSNLHFIVFPSIWECKGRHRNHNTAYVIDYEGNEWFGQEKLRRFPWEKDNETFLEDIIEGEEIHIIHCEGYGSIAVAVCRSELDWKVRDLLMQKLNVKLILCPSWTEGRHEFECSIMTGLEHKCNVVWCNTCSALEIDKDIPRTVGIITTFGKNKNFSNMSLTDCKFPENNCLKKCEDGCFYSGRIYGTDYRENQMVEVGADGCENE